MKMEKWLGLACVAVVLGSIALPVLASSPDYWAQTMKDVHFNSTNIKGAIARFGDSITYSGAFFKPLAGTFTTSVQKEIDAQSWLHTYVYSPCWGWQDDAVAASDGNYSGTTSAWPMTVGDQFPGKTNIAGWLTKLRPDMAVIMWGTNDLGSFTVTSYTNNMRSVVQACLNNGTIPLLTTIPPKVGNEAKALQFAQAMRDLAVELKVPLIDYSQAIYDRRPGTTWQNTLISGDGVHPSGNGRTTFSATDLANDGYLLRNYVTLMKMYDVYSASINVDPVQIKYTTTDLGGGKKGYSFYLNGLATASNAYNINLAFAGNIQQQKAYGANVDKQDDADAYTADPGSGYNEALDSYFYNPFAGVSTITRAVNRFTIAAGCDPTRNANLAYIVTDGQINLTGTVKFNSKTYNISLQLGPHSGDANNSGTVDVVDLGILAANYDGTGKGWLQADYNGDGLVDVVDLGILAANYDWISAGSDGSVPEPATLSLLAAAGVLALRKRK